MVLRCKSHSVFTFSFNTRLWRPICVAIVNLAHLFLLFCIFHPINIPVCLSGPMVMDTWIAPNSSPPQTMLEQITSTVFP